MTVHHIVITYITSNVTSIHGKCSLGNTKYTWHDNKNAEDTNQDSWKKNE